MKKSSIAETKANFSELVSEVAYTGQSIIITERGRPMAKPVPVDEEDTTHIGDIAGWLDADNPFFDRVDEIVDERQQHLPRLVKL